MQVYDKIERKYNRQLEHIDSDSRNALALMHEPEMMEILLKEEQWL